MEESHPDVIAIDEHAFMRAVAGQLARTLVTLTSSEAEVDEQVACMSIPVQVKGNGIGENGERLFSIEHLVTSDLHIDGVILRCPIYDDFPDDPSEDITVYILVRLAPHSHLDTPRSMQVNPIIYKIREQEALQHRPATMRRLMELLYAT